MAAKDKIETGLRLLFDDVGGTARDLSVNLIPGSLTAGGFTFEIADMTGVSQDVRNNFATWATASISGQFHVDDTASTGTSVVFHGYTPALINTGGTLTVQWGSAGAAPTTGDLEWEGEYVLTAYPMSNNGSQGVFGVTWEPLANAAAPAWGTVT